MAWAVAVTIRRRCHGVLGLRSSAPRAASLDAAQGLPRGLPDGGSRISDGFPQGIQGSEIAKGCQGSGGLLPNVPLWILQALDEGDDGPPIVHAAKGDHGLEANAAAHIPQHADEPGNRATIAELA